MLKRLKERLTRLSEEERLSKRARLRAIRSGEKPEEKTTRRRVTPAAKPAKKRRTVKKTRHS